MQYVTARRALGAALGRAPIRTQKLDWALTSSGVQRDEPDRSEFVQVDQPHASGGELSLAEHRKRGRGPHVLDAAGVEQ